MCFTSADVPQTNCCFISVLYLLFLLFLFQHMGHLKVNAETIPLQALVIGRNQLYLTERMQ